MVPNLIGKGKVFNMGMSDEKIIKQDSPENILWQLFRIEVEKQLSPEESFQKTKDLIQHLELAN